MFESVPGIELALERLDPQVGRQRPELRTVREISVNGQTVEQAVVWLPDGTAGYFLRRIEQYLASADAARPRHLELIDRIESIRLATLEAFWTDARDLFPAETDPVWWEIWLRRKDGQELQHLRAFATDERAEVGPWALAFPDRVVALVFASTAQLGRAVDVLDDLAELRHPNPHVEPLADQPAAVQAEWVNDLAARTTSAGADSPHVCLLDTGVQHAHPLLSHSLGEDDCHACDPRWGVDDHKGHGTEMAGLALYGSLADPMLAVGGVRLKHRLESVKLLSPANDTPEELWGAMTAIAASLVEIQAPDRRRVFALSATADSEPGGVANRREGVGQPTAWSATVDALAAGQQVTEDGEGLVALDPSDVPVRRLFIVAAGNIDDFEDDFLTQCDLHPIEDPAQSWNALTIGAMTDLTQIAAGEPNFAGWTPLAPRGELSPFSRTSVAFDRAWPAKPDVVVEGGNVARSPNGTNFDTPTSFQLLTTRRLRHDARLLTVTRQTSAATAQAAYIAGSILASYPTMWPETVRALIVHSAEWTDAMRTHVGRHPSRTHLDALRRRYGMGVPDVLRATRSASDALTLVAEDVIRPYRDGQMREMHLHRLPWPTDELAQLGAATTRLRVTLSYFIEPNAARRGWARRFSYQSHGLRFDLRRATESDEEFRGRINARARGEDWDGPIAETDASDWLWGPDLRASGSIHSDIWEGTAADLARRGVIAVYPVGGWWKERHRLDRSEFGARYSLVVSIETPGQEVDLWTPVALQAGIAIEIET